MRNTTHQGDNKQSPTRPQSATQGQPGNMVPDDNPEPERPDATTGQTIGDTAGEGGDRFHPNDEPALTGTAAIQGARRDEDANRRRHERR